MCHRTELRVAGDEAGVLADGGSDGKGIRIRHGELRLEPRRIEDLREAIGEHANGECFQAVEELFSLLDRAFLGDEIVHLTDIDFVHEQRFAGCLRLMQQGPNAFEPALPSEIRDQGERVEHAWLLHESDPPGVPAPARG